MSAKIKLLVMDVDGTLTDGKIYMGKDGEVCKAFHVKDGYGIHHMLIPADILPVIITGRSSQILERRCMELGITEVHQGVTNKMEQLNKLIQRRKRTYSQVAYIGDDLNDLECMRHIKEAGGLTGCPADGAKQVCGIVDFVSQKNGGEGAVREFIEWIVRPGEKLQ